MKVCENCNRDKSNVAFGKDGTGSLNPWCIPCVKKDTLENPKLPPVTKSCPKCETEKSLEDFYIRKASVDGRAALCIVCNKKKNSDAYSKNPAKVIASVTRYYEANKPAVTAYRSARKKRLMATDPNFKLKERLRTRVYHALIGGYYKAAKTMALVGCTVEELWIYLEAQFEPGMTRENYGEWHVDHIYPLAWVDLTNKRMQFQAFNYLNLRPLWGPENEALGGHTRSKDKP